MLTAGFTEKPAARFGDGFWEEHRFWVREGTTDLAADSAGNAWIGTRGNGLWRLSNGVLSNYDEKNSTLRADRDTVGPGVTWVFVHGLATDGRYLYVACYRDFVGYPVGIADLDKVDDISGWDSLGADDGLDATFAVSIDLHDGNLAVGSETKGVYVCHVGDEPFLRPVSYTHLTLPTN